ncbi:MAG TPA: secretin N-terminal domain-containing protein [Planctomycetota bacterium]
MLPTAVSLLLATLAALPAPQDPVQDVPIPEGAVQDEGDYLVLKFDETEDGLSLRQFVKVCQINTGRNFTLDDNPTVKADLERKRLLLFGSKRIRKQDFYSFFQIMMKINGFVCVQQGSGDLEVVKIVRADATNQGEIKANTLFVETTEVEFFADKPGTYITTVVPVQYANATTLGTSLRTALASGGVGSGQDSFMPLQNEGGSALLVQGYGPFVAWAVRLVRILDKEPILPEAVFRKIQLREASSEEMAQLLQDLIEDSAGGGPNNNRARNAEAAAGASSIPTKIIANARDNSLIVVAEPKNMEKVMDLVAQLDTVLETPETNFRVYQLQNISAVDLEEDLVEFLNRTQQAEEQAARSSSAPGAQASRAEQRIVIQSQEETNSLLITATRTKWAELERLLDRLDQRQPQVLIETALIEVSEDFTRDIGVELASVNPPDGDFQRGFGFTSVGISTLLDQDGDNLPDTRVPSSSNAGMTAGVLDGADFGLPFLIAAAQRSSNTNILSIPSILVTNNRVARVESTDEIPVTEQTTTQGVGVTETFRGFEEAGIKLEITPSISARKYLRLGITLEISAFRGVFSGGTIPPPRVTRKLETTVYLPDGATMWVGGIIRDDFAHDEQGVPWLSDIPVLGWVFGRDTKSNVKTTLYFFCTPRIMDDFEELADLSELGKSRAAEVIGLDRVRQVDPAFRFGNPLDVILDEDVDGDGETETGMLDVNSFAAPVFIASTGFIAPEEVGAEPRGLLRRGTTSGPASSAADASSLPAVPRPRNLPQNHD